jgi:hypothetical protein
MSIARFTVALRRKIYRAPRFGYPVAGMQQAKHRIVEDAYTSTSFPRGTLANSDYPVWN